jgi:riboflavin kinase/FMN adenylyltransferase
VELIRDLDAIDPRYRGGVLSVGVFDGVHVGHRKVLGCAVERARALGAAALVFTFHPHPLDVLAPGKAPPLLQTFGQKLELMREIGIAAVVWPETMEQVLAMPPETFVERVVHEALGVRVMVEGSDFKFGAGAGGDCARLVQLAQRFGFDVDCVADVAVDGERVSSTRIRCLIAEGRVAEAARCLGRPYSYIGVVVEGRHRGAKLGFPTVNVASPRFLVPGEGVYAGWAVIEGEKRRAAIGVGRAPTFHGDHPVTVEAYILDFEKELYGHQVAVEFVEFLRPQRAFADPQSLKVQMARDCQRVREILSGAP